MTQPSAWIQPRALGGLKLKPWPPKEVNAKFKRLFGVGLKGLFSPLTGFDVVKFDEEVLKTPDGISTADYIKQLHGPEAVELVKGLL